MVDTRDYTLGKFIERATQRVKPNVNDVINVGSLIVMGVPSGGDADHGRCYVCVGAGGYIENLYFLLNFAMTLSSNLKPNP